jgi:hypothetical protein
MYTLKDVKQAASSLGFVVYKTNAKVNGKQAYRVSDVHGLFTKSSLISIFLES